MFQTIDERSFGRDAADKLAGYIAGGAAIDATASGYARLLLLDFIGVGLLGCREPRMGPVESALRGLYGSGSSTTLRGMRLPAPQVAFMNALFAHSTDWDDSHLSAITHPGAPIWGALLALAETGRVDGEELVEAAVVGYETTIRLGQAIQPQHMFQGFHGTATCGVFGAAAASARLLGLDRDETRHALGIAASSASGLTQCILAGSHAKSFQTAKAANDGVMAAVLARAGMDAPTQSIEGPRGFLRAYAGGQEKTLHLDGLGKEDARILGVMIKRYPIAAHLHGAVDAAMGLVRAAPVDPRSVASIEVVVDPAIARNNANTEPRDLQAACMSLPFCIACILAGGGDSASGGLDHDRIEHGFGDGAVMDLAKKVECIGWPADAERSTGSSMWSRITVSTATGSREAEADPRWGARAPDARAIIVDKFLKVTAGILTSDMQRECIANVLDSARLTVPEIIPAIHG